MKCANCGAAMGRAKHFHARTCSDRCRKALSRRKSTFKRRFQNILSEIANIYDDLNRYPELHVLLADNLAALESEVVIMQKLYGHAEEVQIIPRHALGAPKV